MGPLLPIPDFYGGIWENLVTYTFRIILDDSSMTFGSFFIKVNKCVGVVYKIPPHATKYKCISHTIQICQKVKYPKRRY